MNTIVTLYKCDECSGLIRTPEQGRVIHGNICMADPTQYGGLVGNNFPQNNPPGTTPNKFTKDEVGKTVLCIPCFMKLVLPDSTITNTRRP